MAARTDWRKHLVDGTRRHLDPLLVPAGFEFAVEREGQSCNGPYASGAYENGAWRLEMHVRYTLGLIRFRHGEASVDLGSYLRAVDRWEEAIFPKADGESLDAFAALAADIQNYCADFVHTRSEEFAAIVAKAQEMNSKPRKLP